MLLPGQCCKKERTKFVNADINIRMPEIIHSKTSFECSRQLMGNRPKMTEGTEKIVPHSESSR